MNSFERLPHYFQLLSDINRLRIIKFIDTGERTVTEIVKEMNLSQPLVSHHLKTLKNSYLLETKREGPFIFYKLKETGLLDVLGIMEQILPLDGEFPDYNPMFFCPAWWKKFNGFHDQ